MKKKFLLALALFAALMFAALAVGEGPVLLVQIPENAQMVENIQFDDGDFIQTYQLTDGSSIQLLRFAFFNMTAAELAQSEWPGCSDLRSLALESVGGCAADGIRFSYQERSDAGVSELEVTTILVQAGGHTLMFEAICPQQSGEAQEIDRMIETLDITGLEADVG